MTLAIAMIISIGPFLLWVLSQAIKDLRGAPDEYTRNTTPEDTQAMY